MITATLLMLGGSLLVACSASATAGADALPDRVGTPPLGTLRITDPFPIGAAAVAVSGFGGDETGSVAVVDAATGRYRLHRVGVTAPAGEVALLCPDGTRLAHQWSGEPWGDDRERTGVAVVDLGDGSVETVGPGIGDSVLTRPLGWSPDGNRLVLTDSVPRTPDRSAYRTVVSLVDVASGQVRELAATDDDATTPVPGYAVAFTADGRRLALQLGTELAVVDLTTGRRHTLDLPAGRTLAGKGAWQPDGGRLTLVEHDGDDWRLIGVDPTTGAEVPGQRLPAVTDMQAVRLLGWQPDGAALVVAYQPGSTSRSSYQSLGQRISYGHVSGVQLMSLAPGATTPTVRVTAADGVRAIDVADRALATGVIRPGQEPPRWPGPRFWLWPAAGLVVAALLPAAYRAVGVRRRLPDHHP